MEILAGVVLGIIGIASGLIGAWASSRVSKHDERILALEQRVKDLESKPRSRVR